MKPDEAITTERLERALVAMAYVVVRHGAVYAPLLDRLERELEERRRKTAPVERARKLLEAYTLTRGPVPALPVLTPGARPT